MLCKTLWLWLVYVKDVWVCITQMPLQFTATLCCDRGQPGNGPGPFKNLSIQPILLVPSALLFSSAGIHQLSIIAPISKKLHLIYFFWKLSFQYIYIYIYGQIPYTIPIPHTKTGRWNYGIRKDWLLKHILNNELWRRINIYPLYPNVKK